MHLHLKPSKYAGLVRQGYLGLISPAVRGESIVLYTLWERKGHINDREDSPHSRRVS